MKHLIVLFAAIAAACGVWKGGLRVRFDAGLGIGSDFFYDIPRTVSAAIDEGWTAAERPAGPLPSLVLYCLSPRHLCVFYDDTEYVAGVQVALPINEFTDAIYDWEVQGFTKWAPSDEETTYWVLPQFFVSEAFLEKSPSERIASRDSNKVIQEDGIWVTGINKELLKISNSTDEIASSIFTRQACIPWMGRHFYYNMSSTTECNAQSMYPWFPLVESGELIGTGFIAFGKLPENSERDWFERPAKLAVQAIVPDGPSCLYELADSPGLVTMHIYYIDQPWIISCLFQ